MSEYTTTNLISYYEPPTHPLSDELLGAIWHSRESPLAFKAQAYAIRKHRETNHYYDDYSYEYHLHWVFRTADPFMFYIRPENMADVYAACYCHDLIEDCRQTYNDIKIKLNKQVAEIVFLLTEDKGRNRKERHSDKYYEGIKSSPEALFVKLCDRIANVEHNKRSYGPKFEMYAGEHFHFKEKLYTPGQFEELWHKLETLFI